MKKCWKCKETKPFGEFHYDRHAPDGCQSMCKPCKLGHTHAYRETEAGKAAIVRQTEVRQKDPQRRMAYRQYLTLYHARCRVETTEAAAAALR